MKDNNLSQWLQDIGFKRNPFEGIDAKDEPYLEEYFIHPSGFEDMIGRNSAVLYAPRGGGKTACRRMIENACKTGDFGIGKILAIDYNDNDFQTIVESVKGKLEEITARRHVEAIIKNALPKLKDKSTEIFSDELTPTQLLEKLSALSKDSGFEAIFILIDNVDGLPATDNNPENCFNLLSSLIGTSSLIKKGLWK